MNKKSIRSAYGYSKDLSHGQSPLLSSNIRRKDERCSQNNAIVAHTRPDTGRVAPNREGGEVRFIPPTTAPLCHRSLRENR
jgi:hypothetical protein